MRCLYCGNELALLKKLTGGGEFCSEAHRQKYQEEYNRLALSRLLQAQPDTNERPALAPERKIHAVAQAPVPDLSPAVAVATAPEPKPQPTPPPLKGPTRAMPDPPEPGFLVDRFDPVLSPRELFSSDPSLAP